MSSPQYPFLDVMLKHAIVHEQAGRLLEAEQAYRSILDMQPNHADANHNLGVLTMKRGDAELGLLHFKIALKANPNRNEYWLSYASALLTAGQVQGAAVILEQGKRRGLIGPAYHELVSQVQERLEAGISPSDSLALYAAALEHHRTGHLPEAVDLYGKVIALKPDFAEAHVNLGNALFSQGELDKSITSLARAMAIQPDSAKVHYHMGQVLEHQSKVGAAISSYSRALEVNPDYVDAHFSLGNLFMRQRELERAIASYNNALNIKSDFAEAHYCLGSTLCEYNRVADGFASFTRYAELVYGTVGSNAPNSELSLPHKRQHDQEQRDYLALSKACGSHPEIDAPYLLADGRRITTPAINRHNAADAAKQWQTGKPQIVVIDDLLTENALDKLRRFCWGSTIWRKVYDEGYLGALPEFGFACPLLSQIAEELRGTFPAIFGEHPLLYLWAFKYDSRLTGTKIHADQAVINVNFWITPDEANLDPNSGGLVIWDAAAPLDWAPAKYNADPEAARAFLAQSGARARTVPYRSNRAVIFDSDLFHETDRILFRDGYLNRRINITLLFGRRMPGAK